MPYVNPHWLEGQHKRWLRPDAARHLRPDWRDRKYWTGAPPPGWMTHPLDMALAIDARRASVLPLSVKAEADITVHDIAVLRRELLDLKEQVARARCDLAWRRLTRAVQRKYSPDQPRVPAGNAEGGQWTSEGGGDGIAATDDVEAQGDEPNEGSAVGRGSGHHYVPREIFDNEPFSSETRQVFDEGRTGPLRDQSSNRYDIEHRMYNQAVREHYNNFLSANDTNSERLTPDQARAFLDEVKRSDDPRIRRFNMRLWMREIMRRIPRRGDD